jgi:hypothetical protein
MCFPVKVKNIYIGKINIYEIIYYFIIFNIN